LGINVRNVIRTGKNEVIDHSKDERARHRDGNESRAYPLVTPHESKSNQWARKNHRKDKDILSGRESDMSIGVCRSMHYGDSKMHEHNARQPGTTSVRLHAHETSEE
jgi:hypothetical protein